MNKLLKSFLLIGTLFLLVGCRNQIQKDFLNRTVKLINQNHAEGSLTFSDLEDIHYQFVFQKDQELKENQVLHLEIIFFEQNLPLLDATIINKNILLSADSFLEATSPCSDQNAAGISWDSWNQLKEDHQDRLILLNDEITVEDRDLQKSDFSREEKKIQSKKARTFKKQFLKLDSKKFTETETELTLEIKLEELKNLFSPLLEQDNLPLVENIVSTLDNSLNLLTQESTELELILNKQKSFLMFKIISSNSASLLQENFGSVEVRIDFSNRKGDVKTPSTAMIVTSGRLQNILTPIHKGYSLTGYSPSVFNELIENTIKKRENYEFNEWSATTLLDSYSTLLTEDQYQKLEAVLDIDTLKNQFDDISSIDDWSSLNHQEVYEFSQEGYPSERFTPLIESIKKYRSKQTKKSAQKILEKYRHVLNEKQYNQLEEVLDIDTLPE
ncbi:hypothetical protein LZ578_00800 [Jeotgalibaca sp. MA1X17-3]|uniref:hypothetical protein n=1 Tax=Jeotgalibaca sp. MA1X17-3 TaxID=2908211 RepID=UPI001F477382|nr:hypothetical protein [Jeotgalibaca sp. MA1X17-3]UJF15772.1 hypothetical protein LZ578_00800 [Jeotgalibaca sp. MA1X17-3]